ncbi:MAG TPA: hypothetical protein VIC34_15965 [Croceibacterium sp.]
MTLSRARPLAIYAVIAMAILLAAHATNAVQEPFLTGIFMVAFGLWGFSDFLKGQCWAPLRVDRANDPVMFWIGHAIIQAVVALILCFPWLYPLFERLTS